VFGKKAALTNKKKQKQGKIFLNPDTSVLRGAAFERISCSYLLVIQTLVKEWDVLKSFVFEPSLQTRKSYSILGIFKIALRLSKMFSFQHQI
jgi:hypothetical protein